MSRGLLDTLVDKTLEAVAEHMEWACTLVFLIINARRQPSIDSSRSPFEFSLGRSSKLFCAHVMKVRNEVERTLLSFAGFAHLFLYRFYTSRRSRRRRRQKCHADEVSVMSLRIR